MPALYIEILIRKLKVNSNTLVQSFSNSSDEMIEALIAYKYFEKNGTFLEFVEYLKTRKDFDVIFDWLKNEIRFETYNFLLEITVNVLKENDFDFLENISSITMMMLRETVTNIGTLFSEEIQELPTLTLEELDNLFYEFLKWIGAPDEWKQMYDDLKNSGRITFENQVDNIDNSMCYRDENGVLRLLISIDGTVRSFCTLVHEFVHYVSWSKNQLKNQNFSIIEFPSIFFEKISAKFLKNKGYKQDVIDKVVRVRNKNNKEIYIEISSLFNDLSVFIKGGPISKDKKVALYVEFYEDYFKSVREIRENFAKKVEEMGEQVDLSFLELPKVDISEEVDKEYDALIESLIQDGLLVINGYQYLLDTFLADEVLRQTADNPTIITRMIDITNNLGNLNLQNILDEFDMHDLFSQVHLPNEENDGQTYSKKRTPQN